MKVFRYLAVVGCLFAFPVLLTSSIVGEDTDKISVTYTVPALSATTSAAQHNNVSRLGGGLLFAGMLLFSVPGARRRRHLLAMLVFISIVGFAAGCGNVSGSKSAKSETYTFTVTSTATAYGATTTQTSTFYRDQLMRS